MAVDLMGRPALAVLLLAAAAAAHALGPAAPFTPPPSPTAPGVRGADGVTVPVADAPPVLSGLRLHSHPMALVDGQWLRPGERVREARIDSVRADGVRLRHPDGRLEWLAWNAMPPAVPAPPASVPSPARSPTP